MKTILITGATEGVGKATAQALARQRHQLILHGRSADKLNAVIADIEAATHNPNLHPVVADFASLAEVRQMADTLWQNYDHLDVLINNAAAMFSSRTVSAEGFERMLGSITSLSMC